MKEVEKEMKHERKSKKEKFILSIGGTSSRRFFDMLRKWEKSRVPVVVVMERRSRKYE